MRAHFPNGDVQRDDTAKGVEEGVSVIVRIRPPTEREASESGGIAVTINKDNPAIDTLEIQHRNKRVCCQYDTVFGEDVSQIEMFDSVRHVVAKVVEGYNACIFAFGQTGAGKTYTMLGPETTCGPETVSTKERESWGIIPRAVTHLIQQLRQLQSHGSSGISLHCSFMHIYNEKLHDLLQEQGLGDNLKIHEMKKSKMQREIYVSGLAEYRVKDVEDVLELIERGNRNRVIRATECNEVSSRSHAILQLLVEVEERGCNGQRTVKRAKLSMIDLAGSEKIKKQNEMTDEHLCELRTINKSLSALGNVIGALSEKGRRHVPYRDSKLTYLMKDSLGGNCRMVVIACLSPARAQAEESVSTSHFADRARNVMVRVKANEVVDDKVLLGQAQAQITKLQQLLKQNMKANNGGSQSAVGLHSEEARNLEDLRAENAALRVEVARLRRRIPASIQEQSGDREGQTLSRRTRDRQALESSKTKTRPDQPIKYEVDPQLGLLREVRESRNLPIGSHTKNVGRDFQRTADKQSPYATPRGSTAANINSLTSPANRIPSWSEESKMRDQKVLPANAAGRPKECAVDSKVRTSKGSSLDRKSREGQLTQLSKETPHKEIPHSSSPSSTTQRKVTSQELSMPFPSKPPRPIPVLRIPSDSAQASTMQHLPLQVPGIYARPINNRSKSLDSDPTVVLQKEEARLSGIREKRQQLELTLNKLEREALLDKEALRQRAQAKSAAVGSCRNVSAFSAEGENDIFPGQSGPLWSARARQRSARSRIKQAQRMSTRQPDVHLATAVPHQPVLNVEARRPPSVRAPHTAPGCQADLTRSRSMESPSTTTGVSSISTRPAEVGKGREGLRYNIGDIGMVLRVYSYRYAHWSACTVVGYDRYRKMHYLQYHLTKEKLWQSLSNKKLEVMAREREGGPTSEVGSSSTYGFSCESEDDM